MTCTSVKSFHEAEVLIDDWNGRVQSFIREGDQDLIADKSMVFIVQCQMFLTYTDPSRTITVIVSYQTHVLIYSAL